MDKWNSVFSWYSPQVIKQNIIRVFLDLETHVKWIAYEPEKNRWNDTSLDSPFRQLIGNNSP